MSEFRVKDVSVINGVNDLTIRVTDTAWQHHDYDMTKEEFMRRLIPADPAPTEPDEAWLAEIRARVGEPPEPDTSETSIQIIDALRAAIAAIDEKLESGASRRLQNGLVRRRLKAVQALDSFAYDEYTDIRRLLDALDDARRERDAARLIVRHFASLYAGARKSFQEDGGAGDTLDWIVNNSAALDAIEGFFTEAYGGWVKWAKESDHADE